VVSVLDSVLAHHTIALGNVEVLSSPVHVQALDIVSVDGQPVGPNNFAARDLVTEIAALDPSVRPDEIGTPWPIQSQGFFSDASSAASLHLAFESAGTNAGQAGEVLAGGAQPAPVMSYAIGAQPAAGAQEQLAQAAGAPQVVEQTTPALAGSSAAGAGAGPALGAVVNSAGSAAAPGAEPALGAVVNSAGAAPPAGATPIADQAAPVASNPAATYPAASAPGAAQQVEQVAGSGAASPLSATIGPAGAAKVQSMVSMADSLLGKPYILGGGHAGWGPSAGYDCSGFVSAVLHAGGYLDQPVATTNLPDQAGILAGPGRIVTIYDRALPGEQGHVIISINGQFYESGGSAGPWGGGGGVEKIGRPSADYLATFPNVLHPEGL
jgi:cell wall-associated NlpC family hydrolase